MFINHSFDPDFTELLDFLRKTPAGDGLFRLEGIHPDQLDINTYTREFFRMDKEGRGTSDVSIDGNANVAGKDTITYAYELAKPISKLNSLYNLWLMMKHLYGKTFADHAVEAEIRGAIYINDAHDVGKPYCMNFSTYDIVCEGLKMSNRLDVDPPKSLASFLHQVEQFVVYAANSTLGATGLADLLICVAGYYQAMKNTSHDHHVYVADVETYLREHLTSLIYTLNWEFRGNQSAFTNVSVYDHFFLEQLLPSYAVLGEPVGAYSIMHVQRVFLECMNDILSRTPITFPVTTACFSVEEDEKGERVVKDERFLKEISKANLKFGFINMYMGKSSTLSSCCRLRSDGEGLGYANSFGSGSTKIGSIGVVTLNLPHLAVQACNIAEEHNQPYDENLKAFIELVRGTACVAQYINNAKREFLKDRISRGSLPLYTLGYMSLNRQYSTCGFTGLYEALGILGYDINEDEGLEAAKEVLKVIRWANDSCHEKFKTPHNCEQIPAESAAVKMAAKDRLTGIWGEDDEAPALYSNQFIPLTDNSASILDRMEVQGKLDAWCDGGSILHLNLAQPMPDAESMSSLIRLACRKGVVYFAINLVLCQCENKHMFVSGNGTKHDGKCPVCGSTNLDEYTRVVGFLTNTKHWNKTRRTEDWPNRHFYTGADGEE